MTTPDEALVEAMAREMRKASTFLDTYIGRDTLLRCIKACAPLIHAEQARVEKETVERVAGTLDEWARNHLSERTNAILVAAAKDLRALSLKYGDGK